jgi:hypothetical protein
MGRLFNIFNWVESLISLYTFNIGGGDSPPPAGPQVSTSYSTNLPEYAQPYYTELMKQTGKAVYSTDPSGNVTGVKPYQAYDGQRNAGFTDTQQAQQQATLSMGTPAQFGEASRGLQGGSNLGYSAGVQGLGQALNYQPQQVGTQQFGNQAAQQYMSPFLMQSLAPQLAYQQQLFGQQNASNALGSIGRGTFGGGRQALVNSQNQQNQQMNLSNLLGQGLNTGYLNAQQQFNADQGRGLQAQQANQQAGAQQAALSGQLGQAGLTAGLQGSSALGQLGATQQTADLARLQAQGAVGAQQQQLNQQNLDTAYQNWQTAQNYPKSQLEYMSNILRGNAGALGSTNVQYAPPPSTASQVAGLGLAGLGLYNVLGK